MEHKYLKTPPDPPAIRNAMAKVAERQEKEIPVYDFSSGNIGRLLANYQIFKNFSLSIEEVPEGFEEIANSMRVGIRKAFVESPKGLAYSPTGGTDSQKKTAIRYFNQVHKVPLTENNTDRIIVTAGGQQAMAASLRSISTDSKIIASRWEYAPVAAIANDGPWEFVKLPPSEGLGFSPHDLRDEAEEGSVFYTSMPNNPTGLVSPDLLVTAIEVMEERNGAVIWDAPYLFTILKWKDHRASFSSNFLRNQISRFNEIAAEYSESVCILSSISKTCLAAGLRFGFATAPTEWIENMNAIIGRENLSSPTPSFIMGNEILKAFLDKGVTAHEWASEILADRVNYLLKQEIPLLLPDNGKFGGLYVLMKSESAGEEFAKKLAEEGVIPVTAKPFYGDSVDAVRLSLVSVPFSKNDELWKENVDKLANMANSI